MTKLNKKGVNPLLDASVRLAGGLGAGAAVQSSEALLRRAVMTCLLWEDSAYEDGKNISDQIALLIPQVDPRTVADIAIEARLQQKLRHIPLFIATEMTRYPEHKKLVRDVLSVVVTRVDQLVDVLAIHWAKGRKPIPSQLKLAFADAMTKFDAYQFAKYDREGAIKLRDVLRLCHAKPPSGKEELYKQVNERTLPAPDTWEVALSNGNDPKETWTRLISDRKIGDLAFLRNLRNMIKVGVQSKVISERIESINAKWLLPLNFLTARVYAPQYEAEIEAAMFRAYGQLEKLPGTTVFVMDVSGSMRAPYSAKSTLTRIDAGAAMATLAREQCERACLYATAGSDPRGYHLTERLGNARGFALHSKIKEAAKSLGGGGIFTRQCLAFIADDLKGETIDRVIVISDSQDCDRTRQTPKMIGDNNYIIDVSNNTRGINYHGLWSAEISGWSEHFLTYIRAAEGLSVESDDCEI